MKVAIIGGGIGGLAMAHGLHQIGFDYHLFEASPSWQSVGSGITLAPNGLKALDHLECVEQVMKIGHPIRVADIVDEKLSLISSLNANLYQESTGYPLLACHRHELHMALLEGLEEDRLHLDHSFHSLVQRKDQVDLYFDNREHFACDLVIAADGIYSRVRSQLFPGSRLNDPKQLSWRGICNFIPDTYGPDSSMEAWGAGQRIGYVSLSKGRLYWFAVTENMRPGSSRASIRDLVAMFSEFGPLFRTAIERTPFNQLVETPIKDLDPLKKWGHDRVLLLGDAAHASSPYLGQGANQALEDAAVILAMLKRSQNFDYILKGYMGARQEKANKVLSLSRRFGKMGHISSQSLRSARNLALRSANRFGLNPKLDWLFDLSMPQ